MTPNTGFPGGGAFVTLAGGNFAPGAQVVFDGVGATGEIVAPNTITCFAPAGALGPADVQVVNPDATSTVAPAAFTYVLPLAVASIVPTTAAPGQAVTLTGAGFQPGASVTVGGSAANVVSVASGVLVYEQPSGDLCQGLVTVHSPDLQTASIAANPPPTITSVLGDHGPTQGGMAAALVGTHLNLVTSATIGGAPTTVVSASPSVLFLLTPPGAVGPATIAITTSYGCTATATYVYE
ncbi:MAG TPA: IPT/TIG domain-containing protein [Planctomycetota bacterium]|nr:IPT/TIG domain-containing protein [Planctomycetota bacterium]